jgi:hypothetical protein
MFLPTCPLKLQTGNLTLRNWVRFARFAPGRATTPQGELCPYVPVIPSLALFCTIPSISRPRPAQVGFVSHDSAPELASFCTITVRRASRPRQPAPISGRAGQIGFVSHARPVCSDAVRRFFTACTSRPRSGGTQDPRASQCPDGHTTNGAQIGFVLHISLPAAPRPTRRPLPKHPSPPKFGFVLRIYRPAGPNWVRFARFPVGKCEV